MYIYDPQLTASRGLGAESSVLHGLGKRPEVVSPAAQAAEVKRLTEEITKLAQRNAWAGVDEAYKKLESMGDKAFDLIPKGLASVTEIHQLGAQASNLLGETLLYQTRLLREKRRLWSLKMSLEGGSFNTPEFTQIITDLGAIDKSLGEIEMIYGAVTITPQSKSPSKKQRAQLELIPVVWPFAPDQRRSIEFAAGAIKKTGSFTGLLPAGSYTLADQSFTVQKGTELTGKRSTSVRWGD